MLNTGYEVLDNVLGGIKKKEVIVLTGYSHIGKTTFIINIINNIAKQIDGKILYFYTSKTELDKRLLEKITMDNVEIIIDPNITMENIKLKCEEEIKNNLVLVVIDLAQYLGISDNTKKYTYRAILEEDSFISKSLNSIATDLNIPIICVYEIHRHRITKAAAEDVFTYDYQKILNLKFDKHFPILHNSNKRIFLHRDDRHENKIPYTDNINIKEVSVINNNILVCLNRK